MSQESDARDQLARSGDTLRNLRVAHTAAALISDAPDDALADALKRGENAVRMGRAAATLAEDARYRGDDAAAQQCRDTAAAAVQAARKAVTDAMAAIPDVLRRAELKMRDG